MLKRALRLNQNEVVGQIWVTILWTHHYKPNLSLSVVIKPFVHKKWRIRSPDVNLLLAFHKNWFIIPTLMQHFFYEHLKSCYISWYWYRCPDKERPFRSTWPQTLQLHSTFWAPAKPTHTHTYAHTLLKVAWRLPSPVLSSCCHV